MCFASLSTPAGLIPSPFQVHCPNNALPSCANLDVPHPVSLALAQAAKETGWGTSRFAQEGNALFGQWTWNGEGIRPAGVDKDAKHKVAKFAVLKASVRAYQRNLNTHSSYIEFRKERAIQRDNDETLDSLKLVNYLDKYAETGQQYIDVLKQIIKQNSLSDFDDVNVMPTSNKTKKLI